MELIDNISRLPGDDLEQAPEPGARPRVASDTERKFVKELDTALEVVVYAKLPRGFLIRTPVVDYNPNGPSPSRRAW